MPSASDGAHLVDPDGAGGAPPFEVLCRMTPEGGWTLVGQEVAGDTETLRFLGIEVGSPSDLVVGASALIGVRFAQRYEALRIEWGASAAFVEIAPTAEVFDNAVDEAITITSLSTSDANLQGWVSSAGGAILCRAAASPDVRPGDTSWAIKPADDDNAECGCNSMNWSGRGAYYSGSESCTSCSCWPGSFVGVRDDGEPKAGPTTWTTRLWVR